jgi:subtilisin family serine protease
MRQDIIVRRLELHASDADALTAALDTLRRTVAKQPEDHVKALVPKPADRPPTVTVTLKGQASVIATVCERVAHMPNVRVLRDWLDVPAREVDALALEAEGKIYPDWRALLRIDPEGRSRREEGIGARVVVAVVDSGLMVEHPHLRGRHLWTPKAGPPDVHGARFVGGAQGYDLTDQDGHGTMVAGSILATANAVLGLELMGVKFFDVMTPPAAANAANAIRFAVANEASLINLSFDLGIGSYDLQAAIGAACAAGALVVIAAGNTGSDNDRYPLVPACYAEAFPDNVIVVMATDEYDGKPTFSNFGSASVDLAAPGVRIASTRPFIGGDDPARRYGRYSGTSAAAALVTGAAALLRSCRPDWKAKDVKNRLLESADIVPGLRCRKSRRLNLGRALP